jgi:hypothetical protein
MASTRISADFFGPAGDTSWNRRRLISTYPSFKHHELDIRDREQILKCVNELRPTLLSMPLPSPATTWPPRARSVTLTSMLAEPSISSKLFDATRHKRSLSK